MLIRIMMKTRLQNRFSFKERSSPLIMALGIARGGVGQVSLVGVPVFPLPVCPVTAVSSSLAPHTAEVGGLPEIRVLVAAGLCHAGGQRGEDRHRSM